MWFGAVLFLIGIGLVLWGAERFTDGALATARRFRLSPFFVGALVSGFEPEQLATGVAAAVGGLPQVALGTVIGATVFMLTAGLGLALLLVPMDVNIPKAGTLAMLGVLLPFSLVLWNDGTVSRKEGILLVLVAVGLLGWLYRRSPVLLAADPDAELEPEHGSRFRALALLGLGIGALMLGAELVVRGASALIGSLGISETFFGMTVVAMGESLEETARMVAPARRGHPELAWGNVVGTVVILLAFNLGVIALAHPVTAAPLVLRLHTPYLIGCTLLVGAALLAARRLGRGMGGFLVLLYVLYLTLNLSHLWSP